MWNSRYLRNNNRSAYIAYKSGGVIFPIFLFFFYFLKMLYECRNEKRVYRNEKLYAKTPGEAKPNQSTPLGRKGKLNEG